MSRAIAVAGSVLVAACVVGTPAGRFEPARGPQGVHADLLLIDQARLAGELLAVSDSSLVLLASTIVVVRHRSIDSGSFHQVGEVRFAGAPPAPADRELLRVVSRFPQGLSSTLLERLLRAHGQTEPSVY